MRLGRARVTNQSARSILVAAARVAPARHIEAHVSQPFTVEERFHTARVVQLAAVAALGGFLFGFDTAVINGAVTPCATASG